MSSAPKGPKINWLSCIGDSITNTDSTLYIPKRQQYPKLVQQMIGGSCRERNLGVPGETTAQVVTRLNYDVLRITPTVATIYLGINDCLASVSTVTMAANMQTIVDGIRNAGCTKIIVCQIHNALTATDYSSYRTAIANFATTNSVPLCDFTAVSLVAGDFQADNLHLKASGLAKLAVKLKATLDAQGWTGILAE